MTTDPERNARSACETIMCTSHNEIIGGTELRPFASDSGTSVEPSDAVDMEVLMSLQDAQMEGEPDLVVELIDLYLEDASAKLAAMREAIARTDEASLRRAAHSLRGSSANLGARRMAAICGELERTGCGDPLRVESLRAGLEQECELVRQVFSAERRRRS